MQETRTDTTSYSQKAGSPLLLQQIDNYSTLLDYYGADYQKADLYWQVGSIVEVQGWILHLSVIVAQLQDLLQQLVPLLLSEKVSFKIALNRIVARWLLDGNLDYEQLGKVIIIYPETDLKALALAKTIIKLTTTIKGTDIPTDICLGGIVYTRYGAFNPIKQTGTNGQLENYIYDATGKLTKDIHTIPFKLPSGITWPFSELASPITPNSKRNLQNKYKPLTILKPDARGNVMKGIYLKGLFRVDKCVIKIGKKNMLADDRGRDIKDRLKWQRDLHKELADFIPLPRIFDLFEENGDMYLVMELIKGKSLFDRIGEINLGHKIWFQIPVNERAQMLNWLLKILAIIDLFHQKGFVHRDIAPGNFLIDSQDQITLIDTELAYDLKNGLGEAPFELGTPGFMSPEQERISIPTIKEDIYGLGALMINIFTGLSPIKFNSKNRKALIDNLTFFTKHRGIANLIANCLDLDPQLRPDTRSVLSILQKNHQELIRIEIINPLEATSEGSELSSLKDIIQESLDGLNAPPIPISDGIWMSKTQRTNNSMNSTQKDYSTYAGLHTGISGVLYLIAQAAKLGFNVDNNKWSYKRNWKFIQKEYIQTKPDFILGLYSGSAGIALSLIEGMNSGLLEENEGNRLFIKQCLEKSNNILGLADGVTGQGIVLLKACPYMDEDINISLLNGCITQLLKTQNKDGSWNIKLLNSNRVHKIPVGLTHGMSGIICFLLEYNYRHHDKNVYNALLKSLNYLLKKTKDLKTLFDRASFHKMLGDIQEIGDERTGSILCLIKAYEVLKNSYYKDLAEAALSQYPDFVINNNFSQDGGISGLGEVYLEAARVFGNPHWKKRAERIAAGFIHTAYRTKGETCFWMMDETNKPTADLFVGNAGIIHFLLRCLEPDKLGFILQN